VLPEDLRALYGGDLQFPVDGGGRPYVVGNFVSTLDGVVSYEIPGKAGGGDISGFDEGDRFIMGLLRASADAVIVGAGTLHEVVRGHVWAAEFVNRAASESYAHYREQILHKPKFPLNVVVSGSGRVDLERAIFRRSDVRTVVITTLDGRDRLISAGAQALPATEVRVIKAQGSLLPATDIVDLLWREFDVRLLLHEGGPMLFGSFVAQKLVDEFFLTIAPQVAGRSVVKPRPGMVTGVEFSPDTAPWLDLLSAKQSGDHLYLRYQRHG
jgi:riboflavin biosynthesis pyrimidine reductase